MPWVEPNIVHAGAKALKTASKLFSGVSPVFDMVWKSDLHSLGLVFRISILEWLAFATMFNI